METHFTEKTLRDPQLPAHHWDEERAVIEALHAILPLQAAYNMAATITEDGQARSAYAAEIDNLTAKKTALVERLGALHGVQMQTQREVYQEVFDVLNKRMDENPEDPFFAMMRGLRAMNNHTAEK